jgi:hypothetical protein
MDECPRCGPLAHKFKGPSPNDGHSPGTIERVSARQASAKSSGIAEDATTGLLEQRERT